MTKKPEPFEEEFNRVWARYPRREDRKLALRKYQARRREGVSAEELLRAVEGYAEHVRREKTPAKFIMQGYTFFGPNERWVKYLKLQQAEAPSEYPTDA